MSTWPVLAALHINVCPKNFRISDLANAKEDDAQVKREDRKEKNII